MRAKEKNWGRRLADILKEKGVSQKEAAKKAGVRPSVLSGWLSGASPNDFTAVKRLADSLQTSFTYLLTGEPDSSQSPTINEVFDDGGSLFDGYAKITIQRLIPRKERK